MTALQNSSLQTELPAISKHLKESKEQSTPLIAAKTDPSSPIQVNVAVFQAARLREVTVEAANLRILAANLQGEVAQLKANKAQIEIEDLDKMYNIKNDTILQKHHDGTYWQVPGKNS